MSFIKLVGAATNAAAYFRPEAILAVIECDREQAEAFKGETKPTGSLLLVQGYTGMVHVKEDYIEVMRLIVEAGRKRKK